MTRRSYPGLKIITPPADEQWTLAAARLECRIDADEEDCPPSHPLDPLILEKIPASREYCEDYLGRALAPQVVELALDSFLHDHHHHYYHDHHHRSHAWNRHAIELPLPPVTGIVSVKYIDTDGNEQTMDDSPPPYRLDDYQEPAWLLPAYGMTWPATYAVANAVKIRYNCGYSIIGDSPQIKPLPWKFRAAMSVLLQSMVHQGGAPTPDAVKAAESLMELDVVRTRV